MSCEQTQINKIQAAAPEGHSNTGWKTLQGFVFGQTKTIVTIADTNTNENVSVLSEAPEQEPVRIIIVLLFYFI